MSVCCRAIVAAVPGAREQYGDARLFFHPMDEFALSANIKLLFGLIFKHKMLSLE